jgi:hypothetical protein
VIHDVPTVSASARPVRKTRGLSRLVPLLGACASLAVAGGCSALYVHSDAVQQSLTKTRANLDNAKVMDVFTRQSQYLDALQTQEVAAVIARDVAYRDAQLALFMVGNEDHDGASLMLQDIDTRLKYLFGLANTAATVDDNAAQPLWRRMSNAGTVDERVTIGYQRALKDYQGKRSTDCATALTHPAQGDDDQSAQDAYDRLIHSCQQMEQVKKLEQSNGLPAATPAVAMIPGPYAIAFKYPDALAAVTAIKNKLDAAQAAAKVLDADLDKEDKSLAMQFNAQPGSLSASDGIIKKINSALSESQTYLDNPYAKMVVSTKLGACVQVIVDVTKTTPASKAPVKSDSATTVAAPTSAIDAAASLSAANGGSTMAAGSPASPEVTATTTASPSCGGVSEAEGTAALALFRAIAGVGDAFSKPPRIPHPNVLAVARAQLSYTRDVASEEIADLESQAEAASGQLEAITTEIYMLSRAKTELHESSLELKRASLSLSARQGITDLLANPKTTHAGYRHATAALFYYVSSWNRGHMLVDEIRVQSLIGTRRALVERSRCAAQAYVETIGPGLDTLVAYGSGGIDPKTVAQIIGGLGLVGTAVGVNR